MHNKKKDEELQSRREFFKNAAKGVLPILGAVALSSAPSLVKASEVLVEKEVTGCYGCSDTCFGCSGTCSGTCSGGCKGCRDTCSGLCKGCSGSCQGSCSSSCRGGCSNSCTYR